jgi:uncharacterized membrane protein YbhN (UPF0104 family)
VASKTSAARRWLGWLLRLAVGLALVGWLVAAVDREEMLRALGSIRTGPVLGALALFLVGVMFSAIPWKLLLEPPRIPISWREAVELTFMGFCLNNLTPGGLGGDVLRAWVAARQSRRPVPAVASVLMDRWLALVCLVIMALFITAVRAQDLREVGLLPAALASVAVLVAMFGVSLGLFWFGLRLGRPVLRRLSMGASAASLFSALAAYGAHPRLLGVVLALTLVTPLLDAWGFYLIARGMDLEVSFWPFLLMIPVMRVIHHLPLSVNALGTQDAAMIFYWTAFGVSEAQALVMSLAGHALKILVALLSGGLYLASWSGGRLRVPEEVDPG